MSIRLLNILLPLLAALFCFGNFAVKYRRHGEADYTMLAAGVVLVVIGVLSYRPARGGK